MNRNGQSPSQNNECLLWAMEAIGAGLWDWRIDTGDLYLSPRWKAQLGFADEELPNHVDTWRARLHPDDAPVVYKALRAYFAGESPTYDVELRLLAKDGAYRWIRARGQIVARDDEDRPVRMVGINDDITERKLAEQELRRSEEKFANIFQLSPDAIGISRLEDGKLIEVNRAFEEITGYPREELLGMSTLALWRDPLARARMVERLKHEHELSYEVHRFVARDGREIHGLVSIRRIDYEGEPHACFVVRDVTEQYLAERELRAFQELAEASKDAIVIVEPDTTMLVYANKAAHEMFRCEHARHEMIGMIGSGFWPESDLDVMATVITQGMDVGWRGDIHLRRRDGEVFAANVTVFSIDDGEGDDRHLVAIIRDVTENRRAEERLLFTQASVDHASEAVFWYDVTGRFSYVNEAACRMLGYARETLVGMNVLNVDVTVRPEEFKPRMDALVADGVLEMESVLRRADGVLIDVAISAIALRWNEGSQLVAHIRDISEQKRAELALRDEKNFSDTLIDSLPGVFYLFDEQARLLRWNSTLARVIGQPERWFAGRAVTELIAPEDRPLIAAKFEEILSQGTASVEARLLTVNGAEEPYHFIGRRIVQGDRVLVVGAGIDIAERKASEERLRIIQYAVDRASVAFEWLDLEGKVIAGNIQAYESLGYTREEFIGLNVRDFTPDLTEARWREHVARLRAKGGELVEGRHRRKDGTVYPIEIRANFVQFGGQEYVFSYINDISARQAAQQALRDSERRLAELFDFLPDATFAIDTQGAVIAWNRAMETMSGVGKEAVLGRSDQAYAQAFYGEKRPMLIDLAIDHPDSPLQARTDLIRREGDTLVMEDRSVQTRGDRRVALWAKAAPLRDAEGRVTGAVEVIRDITERTEREAELQQKTDEMTRFTYTVSHDLKSPLVTIRTFLGFLEEDIQNQDADRIAKDLGFIRNAAERMSRLLEELLDLSRLGRVVNNPVDVAYADLVREALDLVAGRVAERGVTISTDAPSLMIHGDHPRLVEVFQNLIDNAVKFMGDQVAPRIDIGVESVEGKWRFHVRDNGMGIDPRYHHKLFDLFEKLDRNVEGSGIGLTLVKRIIELHGGRIWVESAGPGQGSTFFFTLGAVSSPA